MIYIGIDPGLHGAIAILDHRGTPIEMHDMPLDEGTYDPRMVYHYLHQCCTARQQKYESKVIGIEAVYRFPKISMGFGLLVGVASVVPHSTVIKIPPRRWQKWWEIKKADKNLSRELASKRFPGYADRLARKMDHNRAEALLIAEYTRRKHKNG